MRSRDPSLLGLIREMFTLILADSGMLLLLLLFFIDDDDNNDDLSFVLSKFIIVTGGDVACGAFTEICANANLADSISV